MSNLASQRRDAWHTMAAVPLVLCLTCAIATVSGSEPPSLSSSAIFVLMLGAFAGFTGFGRRSGLARYMQGALLVLAMFALCLWSLSWDLDIGFGLIDFLVQTGFYMRGGPDAPIVITGFIWWLSVVLLVLVAFLFGRLAEVAFPRRSDAT